MTKQLGVICALLILATSVGHSQEKETVSAKEVLDRMVSVYASCKSYMDKGRVKEVFPGARGRVVMKPFTTAFVRPSHFRFEFTEDSDVLRQTFVVWRDNASIRSWWSIKPETKYYETLGLAVASATGVSSQSAVVVPSMLFQNLGDTRRVQQMTELSLVTEEKVNGRPAYRIQGKDWLKKSITIWIDKESFLLVKLFEKVKDVELTIQYEPKLDLDVPPEKLAFKH
jgi:outer membrane lipoprotein-sorting protein